MIPNTFTVYSLALTVGQGKKSYYVNWVTTHSINSQKLVKLLLVHLPSSGRY